MLVGELLLLGLGLGLLYGVLALGLTMIWGVMKVVNIAHGDFVIVGAYASYWAFTLAGVQPLLSLLLTIPFGLGVGILLYVTMIRRVTHSPELMSLFLTFGISTFISSLLLYLYSANQRGLPPNEVVTLPTTSFLGLTLPGTIATAMLYAIVVAVFVRMFLSRTFWGKAIRAVTEDSGSAMLMGISPERVSMLTFGIGVAVAMSVGSIVMQLQTITPDSGPYFTLLSFVIVVLGGLGSPFGALIGGVVIGVVDSVGSLYFPAAATPAIGFIILVVVLIVRPSGLLGARQS